MITVLVVEVRAILFDDGRLHELTVIDQTTGRYGTALVSDFRLRDLLGDCPTSDLVEIDGTGVVWR